MNKCRLSNNTRDYAKRYECILDKMIDQMTCVKMTNSISGRLYHTDDHPSPCRH